MSVRVSGRAIFCHSYTWRELSAHLNWHTNFFEVVLHDAVKRHQVSGDVIEDFNRGGLWTHEVERGTSGKDFTRHCSAPSLRSKTRRVAEHIPKVAEHFSNYRQ